MTVLDPAELYDREVHGITRVPLEEPGDLTRPEDEDLETDADLEDGDGA